MHAWRNCCVASLMYASSCFYFGVIYSGFFTAYWIKVVPRWQEIKRNYTNSSLYCGFQSYTIRNLDNKVSTESDIDQYKVKNVQEDPLDNQQKYLDVIYFPVLFPTRHFSKYHPCKVKFSHCEYVKSRLLNKDSRFRKDPQYVFYLLWQKEMWEISAGFYNIHKCTKVDLVNQFIVK